MKTAATSHPKKILVVDDIASFCRDVKKTLSNKEIHVRSCTNPLKATDLLRRGNFDLLLTTQVMKKLSGFDLVREIRETGITTPIIMVTSYGNHESAMKAQQIGVSDYFHKPVGPIELKLRVQKVLAEANTKNESDTFRFGELVSRDPAMKSVFEMAETVALSNSRVLILGETGTGKQLMAQAIHSHSQRKDEPFIEINCAAIPEALLESEFFGHEKGAFTGAAKQRKGLFEQARNGTVFLDEIGEMNYDLQAKLLRVLQDGRFTRVGGTSTLHSNARIIAATNRDLHTATQEKTFRVDLFYRLHVISLTIPPLRERRSDLLFLADHFLRKYLSPGQNLEFTEEAHQLMADYSWPGNVRELEHLMERFSVLHPRPLVEASDLPDYIRNATPVNPAKLKIESGVGFREARDAFVRDYLKNALRLHGGNMAQAARYAQIDRSQFFRMVRAHDLDPKEFSN
ncbi:MAG TPA: sigma-54 dependent transcriptional regulator [Opitutales bacterium]|nr:sigma-54 dependent transcriptional regulator [Opitutales bacterium]